MTQCHNCGADVPADAPACPNCGAALDGGEHGHDHQHQGQGGQQPPRGQGGQQPPQGQGGQQPPQGQGGQQPPQGQGGQQPPRGQGGQQPPQGQGGQQPPQGQGGQQPPQGQQPQGRGGQQPRQGRGRQPQQGQPPGGPGRGPGGQQPGAGGGQSRRDLLKYGVAGAVVLGGGALAFTLLGGPSGGNTPGGTVRAYFNAINSGDFEKAENLIHSDSPMSDVQAGTVMGTQAGNMSEVDLSVEDTQVVEESGDTAQVQTTVAVSAGGGSVSSEFTVEVRKEDGEWRIYSFGV